MYNFDKLLDRVGTNSIKWDGLEERYGRSDVIPMFIADMDFSVLPSLEQALVKRAEHPTYGYTAPHNEFFSGIINWNKARNQFSFSKEEIIPIPGIVCATVFAIQALTKPGDRVLLHTPAYYPFFSAIKDSGREMVNSSLYLDSDGVYKVDFAEMDKLLADCSMFILCSPHNPCGRVWTREELERMVDLCHKHGVPIFSDEIHSDILLGGSHHIPLLALNDKAREISVMAAAPSKTFNIAGIKSSFFVIQNPELFEKINKLVKTFHVGLDLFAFTATAEAYTNGGQWVDELCQYLTTTANEVVQYLHANTKIRAFVPEATFLMWLDFSAYGLSQEQVRTRCIKAGVAMNDGITFGTEGMGFMRLNIGTPRFLVMKALEQLAAEFGK